MIVVVVESNNDYDNDNDNESKNDDSAHARPAMLFSESFFTRRVTQEAQPPRHNGWKLIAGG